MLPQARRWADYSDSSDSSDGDDGGDGDLLDAVDRERAETDPQRVGRRQRDDGRRQRREAQTPDAALSSSARLVELLNAYGAKGGVHPAPRWPANQEMHAQYELTRAKGVYDLADAQVQRATEATMLISAWSRSGVLLARRHADDLARSLGVYLEDLLDGQSARELMMHA